MIRGLGARMDLINIYRLLEQEHCSLINGSPEELQMEYQQLLIIKEQLLIY